jgi:hypothetical protein
MKKALPGILIATLTFFIGLYGAAYWTLYHLPETDPELSPLPEKIADFRPGLRAEFKNLSDCERDGLRGQVNLIYEQYATFVYQDGGFERVKEPDRDTGRSIRYDIAGEKRHDRTVGDCGLPDPRKSIYDDRGWLIERISFKNFEEGDKSIDSRITYTYDENGRLIESNSYDGAGKFAGKTFYQYRFDARGNWLEQICISAGQGLQVGDRYYGSYRRITYHQK